LQDSRNISSTSTYKGGRGSGRDGKRGGRGGHGGRGRGRNIYLGSYSPDQWRKLSAEDKKRVYEGRQKSADTSQSGNSQNQSRTIATTNTNLQSSAASANSNAQMEEAILQGALQGSAAVGEKRANTDSAGSQMSRRRINAISTSQRKRIDRNVSKMKHSICHKDHSNVISGQCELDSHADTCVAGHNCIILEDTDQTVNVSAFSDKHKTFKDIPIVTAATAYDDERDGTTYILILGQAIYMGEDMNNTLICPNQLRKHGVIVEDCPSHLAPTNNPSSHSIICQDDGQELRIGLSLQGVTSYFHTRTPTEEELETCRWIYLSDEHNWDPHSQEFQSQEVNFKELQDLEREPDDRYIYHTVSISTSTKPSLDMVYSDLSDAFDDRCIINVSSTRTSGKQGGVNAETLAKRWNIGIEAAKRTIQCTTQKGIRSTLHPIERRFRTKQAQLRYKQLAGRHGSFYTDTFFSKTTSLNNHKMAQIYVNDLAFSKVYPMAVRSEAGDTLQAFIHDVGIPHSLRSDDAPELMHGKFKQICKDYGINCGYTEPYSPWQNRAEGAVRELKRHVYRKMVSKRSPHRLWDFCCKWSCDVRNKTSGTIFALENRTPFEATLGQTTDISSLAPFDFYDYVWYYDEVAQFPEPRRKVGRWLGEATNFGQAMCYWILSNTAQVIVRSSVQPIPEESHDDILRQEIAELNVKIQERLGDSAEEKYNLNTVGFGDTYDNSVTPDHPPMEPENSMPEADNWDAEAYDQYISAEVLLPKDGQEVLGQVVARKRDADGNPIGRGNSNPILDTRLYEVKFSNGNVAEYSANVIAECTYSQVDNKGRQYVLMDDIIDYV
jgi:ribosomal protein L15